MPYKFLDHLGRRVDFHGLLTVAEIKTLAKNSALLTLQFGDVVDSGNWKLLEKHLLKQRQDVCLRLYGHYFKPCDLSFLTELPSLGALTIDCENVAQLNVLSNLQQLHSFGIASFQLRDFGFLDSIPVELKSLSLGPTKSKLPDLAGIVRFKKLESLLIAGQQKNLQVISELKCLESISFAGLSTPDLAFVTALPALWSFKFLLGGAKDLSFLEKVRGLKELELTWIRGLSNIDFISRCRNLQKLTLDRLKQVEKLPDFAKLKKLRLLTIPEMNGLTNVNSIQTASALESFSGSGKKLLPRYLRQALQAPKLKHATFFFSSTKKKSEFEEIASEYGVSTESKWEELQFE
jgi:Leucine-rich repeat (LRR) protein